MLRPGFSRSFLSQCTPRRGECGFRRVHRAEFLLLECPSFGVKWARSAVESPRSAATLPLELAEHVFQCELQDSRSSITARILPNANATSYRESWVAWTNCRRNTWCAAGCCPRPGLEGFPSDRFRQCIR